MPPGPAYNWLCALHSVGDVLYNAAHIRASQLAPRGVSATVRVVKRTHPTAESASVSASASREFEAAELAQQLPINPSADNRPEARVVARAAPFVVLPGPRDNSGVQFLPKAAPVADAPTIIEKPFLDVSEPKQTPATRQDAKIGALDASLSAGFASPPPAEHIESEVPQARALKSSKVPSSRIGRLFHYGGLAASLSYGAASEALRRTTSGSSDGGEAGSLLMTEANVARLVDKLVQMRGAALKLGQFLSIQDTQMVPPQVEEIFRRVQDSAHYMPDWQTEKVLRASLPDYPGCFTSFTRTPFAAASIGQVHSAVLAAHVSPTGKEEKVAVKVQFPNVRDSLGADLGYVRALLTFGRVLPKGMFLERTVEVMKQELADECDYAREASFLRRFARPDHLGADKRFKVPWAWEGSAADVLVMEHIEGASVGAVMGSLSQADRDEIATRVIELCLKELFVFGAMQTDPNWSNFLWDARTRQIGLVDFGATREYSRVFIDRWLRLLQAAAADDEAACVSVSRDLGYLTGEEDEVMTAAHVRSMRLLGTPFRPGTRQPFSFGPGSEWASAAAEIRSLVPVMLQRRLTPPPRETYSLNRKLSGAFLLAGRLGARVDCRKVWEEVVEGYEFGREERGEELKAV